MRNVDHQMPCRRAAIDQAEHRPAVQRPRTLASASSMPWVAPSAAFDGLGSCRFRPSLIGHKIEARLRARHRWHRQRASGPATEWPAPAAPPPHDAPTPQPVSLTTHLRLATPAMPREASCAAPAGDRSRVNDRIDGRRGDGPARGRRS
jgi:hypothetical protein